jgi:hypothetical protein
MPHRRAPQQHIAGLHGEPCGEAVLALQGVLPELVELPLRARQHVDRTVDEVGVDDRDVAHEEVLEVEPILW